MNKFLSLVLASLLVISVTACDNKEKSEGDASQIQPSMQQPSEETQLYEEPGLPEDDMGMPDDHMMDGEMMDGNMMNQSEGNAVVVPPTKTAPVEDSSTFE